MRTDGSGRWTCRHLSSGCKQQRTVSDGRPESEAMNVMWLLSRSKTLPRNLLRILAARHNWFQ